MVSLFAIIIGVGFKEKHVAVTGFYDSKIAYRESGDYFPSVGTEIGI